MRVCSLFSGIGGIDFGFIQAGFDIVWANECDPDAVKTYVCNFGSDHIVEGDIRCKDTKRIPDCDVLAAGFPCQPFSAAGRQKGFSDPRGDLFYEIARIAKDKLPSVIFLENVPNLLEHDDGKSFLAVYNALVPLGYTFKYRVMDAYEYGNVPQHRSRLFIVAFLDYAQCSRFKFPDRIKNTSQLNDILVRETPHDPVYYYTAENRLYGELLETVTDKNAVYKIRDYGVTKKPYYTCPTLTANMGTYPDRVPILIDDYGIRKITPFECLALQGFPTDFRMPAISLNSAYKQCGNSVAVPAIRRIAEAIASTWNG